MPVLTSNKWGPSQTLGTMGGTVTWSIVQAGVNLTGAGSNVPGTTSLVPGALLGFDWEAVIKEALADWAAIAEIDFMQIEDNGIATGFGGNADIRIAFTDTGPFWGYAFFPGSSDLAGDVFLDDQAFSQTNFKTLLLHELGHAIGLDHVFGIPAIMNTPFTQTMLQADDIFGIQQQYGAEDGIPGFFELPTSLDDVIVLDAPNVTDIFGSARDNRIEYRGAAAIDIDGRGGNDTIISATAGMSLDGGAGDDEISGTGGNATLRGGAGTDTLTGSAAFDRFQFFAGDDENFITDFQWGTDLLAVDGVTGTAMQAVLDAGVDGASGLRLDFGGGLIVHMGGVTLNDVRSNIPPVAGIMSDIGAYPASVVAYNQWVRLTDILTFSDADGDTLQSLLLFDGEGDGDWWLDGTGYLASGVEHVVTDVNNVWFRGESAGDISKLWFKAGDGSDLSDWVKFDKVTNGLPTITVPDQSLAPGGWRQLSADMSQFDPDGGAPQMIELWDSNGANSWYVDGVGRVNASSGYVVDLTGGLWFDDIWYQAEASVGYQTLWTRLMDPYEWGEWSSFRLNSNGPPMLEIADLSVRYNEQILLSDIMTVTDPNGDTLTQIEVWDNTGMRNWNIGGGYPDASSGFVYTFNLDQISVTGFEAPNFSDPPVTETLWVRGFDGVAWSAWEDFKLTSLPPNQAPMVTIGTLTDSPGDWTRLTDIMTITDPGGDPITQIEVWDETGANNWWADGALVDANSGYVTSDIADVWVQADATPGTQPLWVRAFDGWDWSPWERFDLVTTPQNTAPGLTMENQNKSVNEWTRASDVWSFVDAQGDPLVGVELWDSNGSNNWYADGARVDASSGYVTTSGLNDIWFQGDPVASAQTLWLRGFDGQDWGAWDDFVLVTV